MATACPDLQATFTPAARWKFPFVLRQSDTGASSGPANTRSIQPSLLRSATANCEVRKSGNEPAVAGLHFPSLGFAHRADVPERTMSTARSLLKSVPAAAKLGAEPMPVSRLTLAKV